MIAPILRSVFRKDRARSQAETLYAALAEQARAPEFFAGAAGDAQSAAPDTPEGRFDVLSLHMVLVMRRLRSDAPARDRLTRFLQEVFFERLDSALREMGVGDLVVGRKIRTLAESFYGRVAAYELGFREDTGALEAALARNILTSNDAAKASALAAYARAADALLAATAIDDLPTAIGRLREVSRAMISGGKA